MNNRKPVSNLRTALLILLLGVFSPLTHVFAQQQTPVQTPAQTQEPVATQTPVAEEEEAASDADSDYDASDDNADPQQTDGRFIPTEQISQDLGVSFPVDI